MMMQPEVQLAEILHSMGNQDFENHTDFLASIVPKLAELLGYSQNELFFERFLGNSALRTDAVLTSAPDAKPNVVIIVKGPIGGKAPKSMWRKWEQQVHQYFTTSGQVPTLLLSASRLLVQTISTSLVYDPNTINIEAARMILALLARPERLHQSEYKSPGCAAIPDLPVDDIFLLSRCRLCTLLESAQNAVTTNEKGTSFEQLAAELFGSAASIQVKYRRLLTASSEIDLVLELRSDQLPPALAYFGRYALVECKNWASPVGASTIRDFIQKLNATKSRLGIVFSSTGVTGSDAGADALREIQRAFDSNDIHIAVVTDQELQRAIDGAGFLTQIDASLDALRFNLR